MIKHDVSKTFETVLIVRYYPRLFIDRLVALSALCLSWLGRFET
jgi:hypothetical protein